MERYGLATVAKSVVGLPPGLPTMFVLDAHPVALVACKRQTVNAPFVRRAVAASHGPLDANSAIWSVRLVDARAL